MLLKEVMQKSGLTRKQIEILQQKGLIHPTREENGYRNYTAVSYTHLFSAISTMPTAPSTIILRASIIAEACCR